MLAVGSCERIQKISILYFKIKLIFHTHSPERERDRDRDRERDRETERQRDIETTNSALAG